MLTVCIEQLLFRPGPLWRQSAPLTLNPDGECAPRYSHAVRQREQKSHWGCPVQSATDLRADSADWACSIRFRLLPEFAEAQLHPWRTACAEQIYWHGPQIRQAEFAGYSFAKYGRKRPSWNISSVREAPCPINDPSIPAKWLANLSGTRRIPIPRFS